MVSPLKREVTKILMPTISEPDFLAHEKSLVTQNKNTPTDRISTIIGIPFQVVNLVTSKVKKNIPIKNVRHTYFTFCNVCISFRNDGNLGH